MQAQALQSPAAQLALWRGEDDLSAELARQEDWWRETGQSISEAIDRAGTPPLLRHDRFGRRIDSVRYPPDYRRMLVQGYRAGIVAAAVDDRSLLPGYRLGYVTSFFDPGMYCPYTVSLGTVVALLKYAPPTIADRYLPELSRRDEAVWQGATWMTEAGGGSDIGAQVRTVARPDGEGWSLSGDKYFCSNADAELAVVAARPEGAAEGVRGLALFLVPRRRADGGLNFHLRCLKDKIATHSVPTGEVEFDGARAWLLGAAEQGIYLIMEVLNVSRVANCIGAAALHQRALAEVIDFGRRREVFGRPLVDQPLMRRQIEEHLDGFRGCFVLAWEAADLLESVWLETPPYSERHHLFRLLAHLAKYWTAESAIQSAKWAMECHGGAGAIAGYGVERLLREAMILSIWEGSPHRQMLDALELMERQGAHELLFRHLGEPEGTGELRASVAELLAGDQAEREAGVEPVFRQLCRWTARWLEHARLPAGGP